MAEHIHRFVQSLDVWEHPWYRYWAQRRPGRLLSTSSASTGSSSASRRTTSCGREDRVANLLDGRAWDYVVGSVHFMGDDALDVHG